MGRLSVKNWSRFQHYKERRPPWIKLATDTFQNYEFSRLQSASKLLALCIWTLASRSDDGSVPDDFEYLRDQGCLGNSVTLEHLNELIKQGFMVRDSAALAPRKQSAMPETEVEVETKAEREGDVPSLEHYIGRARNLGFRDSAAIAVEHAFAEEVMERKSDPAQIVMALARIHHWTEQGKFAPRLHEVIRRWKEPQELWERNRGTSEQGGQGISGAELRAERSNQAIKLAFDKYRKPTGEADAVNP